MPISHFNSGHHVGAHSAHQMDLYPVVLLSRRAVFVVEPGDNRLVLKPDESTAKSISTVFNGKLLRVISFAQDGREMLVLQIVEDRVEVKCLTNEPLDLSLAQVCHESTC